MSWKLTPLEPAYAMEEAAADLPFEERYASNLWSAMSEAAPTPPEDVLERMAEAFLAKWCSSSEVPYADAMRAALAAAKSRTDD